MTRKTSGLVAVPSNFDHGPMHPSHRVGHKNLTALTEVSGVVPLQVPAMDGLDFDLLLDRVDGVLLTGGRANVEPHHYDGDPTIDCGPHDPGRDAVAFALTLGALERGIPLFGICRGIQEMNVALGGSLFPWLHEVPGRDDHRREKHLPMEDGLRARHRITLTPDGLFQQLADGADTVVVNSLHGQAIDRPADGLIVEAVADDGTIEGIRVENAANFAVGIQWHAEWDPHGHPFYNALFSAFGDAVSAHADRRAAGLIRVA